MKLQNFQELVGVIKALRDPQEGCPWDLKQTHKSLLKYLIEESYEFIHAVEKNDFDEMQEELGDILLQVLLHATIAEQDQKFDLESISKTLAEKLIYRHPHVFKPKDQRPTPEAVEENWQKLKEAKKGVDPSHIPTKCLHLPALEAAMKIGKKSKTIKFDWDSHQQVSYKVEEEWQELKEEIITDQINKERAEDEVGDLLFSVAQLARHLEINPEDALRKANKKFLKRFHRVEDLIKKDNKEITQMNQSQMDVYWDRAKMEP